MDANAYDRIFSYTKYKHKTKPKNKNKLTRNKQRGAAHHKAPLRKGRLCNAENGFRQLYFPLLSALAMNFLASMRKRSCVPLPMRPISS